jgi:hypothetical protein
MFLITLVSVGAAVGAWLRPTPHETPAAPAAPTYTEQQIADAKSNVCKAYAKIHHAVDVNAPRNGGSDPTSQLAVTTNMRQIYVVGSAYLLTTLDDEPAAPSDLAAATRKLAKLLQVLTVEGSVSDPSSESYNTVNTTGTQIEGICK